MRPLSVLLMFLLRWAVAFVFLPSVDIGHYAGEQFRRVVAMVDARCAGGVDMRGCDLRGTAGKR